MSNRSFSHTVSDFLFSSANREFLIFLFFFAISGIFWLVMTLNETYEKELEVPVYYTDIEKNAVLTSAEVDTIKVTVRDKGYMIATYSFDDALHPLAISFKAYAHSGRGIVPASDLIKHITGRFNASTKIVSFKPDRLVFYYNKGERRRVPVRYRGSVVPNDLYYIANISYSPDSVTVYAPKEKLDSINLVYTEQISYSDFRDTLTVNTRLQRMSGVKIVPDKVTVSFMTDVLTEGTIDNIPIEGINMPVGKILRPFPARAAVKFVTGVNTYRTLSASDFKVVADYNEIDLNLESPVCNIKLVSAPKSVRNPRLVNTQVDYLIEEIGQ